MMKDYEDRKYEQWKEMTEQILPTLMKKSLLTKVHLFSSETVFLPGESHGQRSLVGYSPWGHKSRTRLRTKPPPPPTCGVEYLFMYLFDIINIFFGQVPLQIFCSFEKNKPGCLSSCYCVIRVLYVFWTEVSIQSDMSFVNIFSQSVTCTFVF